MAAANASTIRAATPIQPFRTAITTKKTAAIATAIPPTQPRTRPPRSSSRSNCGPRAAARQRSATPREQRRAGSGHALAAAGFERRHALEIVQALLDRGFICSLLGEGHSMSAIRYHSTFAMPVKRIAAAMDGFTLLDPGARAFRGHRRAGDRAQRRVPRLVRGRARRVPARVRRRLPGVARSRDRGARPRVALPLPDAGALRRRARRPLPLRRPARRALPLRVRDHARRGARRGRPHRARLRRRGDDAPDARSGLARRRDQRGRGGGSVRADDARSAFSKSRASCCCSRSESRPR